MRDRMIDWAILAVCWLACTAALAIVDFVAYREIGSTAAQAIIVLVAIAALWQVMAMLRQRHRDEADARATARLNRQVERQRRERPALRPAGYLPPFCPPTDQLYDQGAPESAATVDEHFAAWERQQGRPVLVNLFDRRNGR